MEKHNRKWSLAASTAHTTAQESQETGGEQTPGCEEEEDDDETLSLSALPLIHQWRIDHEEEEEENINRDREKQIQDDFDFCSVSKNSEMCAADEVFFQGQILPLRDSVSSEKGLSSPKARSISRSESMDRFYPGPGGLVSSRSSSISSHQSTSSSSGSSIGRPKLLPARNQFHSHPSPSPKLRFQGKRNDNHRNSSAGKSSAWSVFRLGVVAARPEIAFQDLKSRARSRNFGSRNSTDSSIGSRNRSSRGLLLGGGCRCSADAVDTVIKRSASEGEERGSVMKKRAAAKKQLSHHRTFEWLRQLSLEDEDDHH